MPSQTVEIRVQSLQDQVRRAREARQAETVIPKVIPGNGIPGGGQLVGKFRTPTFAEVREMSDRAEKGPTKDLSLAAETILATCEGVEWLLPESVNGQVRAEAEAFNAHGYRLNLELAAWLGIEGCDTDRQAVLAIVRPELALMNLANGLTVAWGIADEEIDEELAGN